MLTRNGIKKMENRYIVYDFETSGFNPYYDDIIEIGAKDNFGNQFNVLLNTKLILSNKIVELTGITNTMLKNKGVCKFDGLKKFLDFIYLFDYDNTYLIAHNNDAFDFLFLKDALYKNNLKLPKCKFIDSYRLSQLVLPEIKYHSLKSLGKYFNIINKNEHRALDDCIVLIKLFEILLTFFKQKFNSKDLNIIIEKINNPYL
mgnify:CR=1 FL=1